jgi:hypothetical protein
MVSGETRRKGLGHNAVTRLAVVPVLCPQALHKVPMRIYVGSRGSPPQQTRALKRIIRSINPV